MAKLKDECKDVEITAERPNLDDNIVRVRIGRLNLDVIDKLRMRTREEVLCSKEGILHHGS